MDILTQVNQTGPNTTAFRVKTGSQAAPVVEQRNQPVPLPEQSQQMVVEKVVRKTYQPQANQQLFRESQPTSRAIAIAQLQGVEAYQLTEQQAVDDNVEVLPRVDVFA